MAIIWHYKKKKTVQKVALFVWRYYIITRERGKQLMDRVGAFKFLETIDAIGSSRGLIQLNEIPTICYLFCCGDYDFVSSFKVHREKFDRSGYFFLGAYFSRIRHALFGGIKVWEEVGCRVCRLIIQ
ncbi:hypothetical protein CHH54_12650 [Bacillus sp. 7520-S]|nr:hypothetical protein CHH54_12650 [Bacillus sp. 7520-S]